MNFDKTQQELLTYLKGHKIWRNFIPVAEALLLITAVLLVIGNFLSFGVFSAPIAFLRYLAIILVLAKGNYKVLTLGFGLLTVDGILGLFSNLLSYPNSSFSYLFWAIIYGLLTLAAFKKSGLTISELKSSVISKEGIKQSMNLDEAKQFNMSNTTDDIKSASQDIINQTKDIKNQFTQK